MNNKEIPYMKECDNISKTYHSNTFYQTATVSNLILKYSVPE